LAVAITAAMMQALSATCERRRRVLLFQKPCAIAATHPTTSAYGTLRRRILIRITGRFAEKDMPPLAPLIWTKLQMTARLRYNRKSLGSGQYQLATAEARQATPRAEVMNTKTRVRQDISLSFHGPK
jgi:hypothetical protein